jgi:hypothetical protein
MSSRSFPSRRGAIVTCALSALIALSFAGLLAAAALTPAPAAVLPFIILVCIGCPMLAALELPAAFAVLRHGREHLAVPLDEEAVDAALRRLEELPETHHPLGF